MQDNKGKYLGAINVKPNRKLEFNFSSLSCDTSALYATAVETEFREPVSLVSSLLMAALDHQKQTGRIPSEMGFSGLIFSDEDVERITSVMLKLTGRKPVIAYADTFSEFLQSIASREVQQPLGLEVFTPRKCPSCFGIVKKAEDWQDDLCWNCAHEAAGFLVSHRA